jgi:hypothetical protein
MESIKEKLNLTKELGRVLLNLSKDSLSEQIKDKNAYNCLITADMLENMKITRQIIVLLFYY